MPTSPFSKQISIPSTRTPTVSNSAYKNWKDELSTPSDAEAAQQYLHDITTLRATWDAHMENYKETMTMGKIRMNYIEQGQASLDRQLDRIDAETDALATDCEKRARALKG
jgi:hypothetical protein